MARNILKLPGIAEGKEMDLFWVCSPKRTDNGNWQLPVFFKNVQNESTLKPLFLPIGTLPLLRMGQSYVDGHLGDRKPVGDVISSVTIPRDVQGHLITAIDMGKRLNYYLFKESRIMKEYVWAFSVRGIEYFIPCMEIIRTYYARSETMALSLMNPRKLDSFIDNNTTLKKGTSIHLQLTPGWPKTLLRDADVAHLLWVRENQVAFNVWNSIYENILSQAGKASDITWELKRGIPIHVKPPLDGAHQWDFRGLRRGDGKQILVMEITKIKDLLLPYDKISYASPLDYKSSPSVGENDIQSDKIIKGVNTAVIDDEDGAKPGETPLTFQIPMGSIEFSKPIAIEKHTAQRALSSIVANGAKNLNSRSHEARSENIKVSADNPREFGEHRGIEYKHLEIARMTPNESLKSFLSAIPLLTQNPVCATLDTTVIYLPNVGTAALDMHGQRRVCAVVNGQWPGGKLFCILELSRADNLQVSTLLIYPRKKADLEEIITFLLEGLVRNNGHWDRKLITMRTDFEYDRFKHMVNHNIKGNKGLVRRIAQKLIGSGIA
ncbi:MAG TPA: Tn7-like element transposition protein TnsE [Syntrophomonadaceae bacterium]|nr:Tn7-like element transposition protein TnsE [Syntrophomonadaceae bacterium]